MIQSGKEIPTGTLGKHYRKVFAIKVEEPGPSEEDVKVGGNVITGIFNVCSMPAHILFDIGPSHSFISISFINSLTYELKIEPLTLSVGMPDGSSILCKYIIKGCTINIVGRKPP